MADDRPPELKKRGTAYHEAGHAVAALDMKFRFRMMSVRPEDLGGLSGRHGGVLDINPADLPSRGRGGQIPIRRGWPVAIFWLAGSEAELIETGYAWGSKYDVTQVETRVIMGHTIAAVRIYKQRAAGTARMRLKARWAEVRAIAEALLEHERLEYEQVAQIAAAARKPTRWSR